MSDIKEIPPNTLVLFGIIGGLVGIYVSPYFPTAGRLVRFAQSYGVLKQ